MDAGLGSGGTSGSGGSGALGTWGTPGAVAELAGASNDRDVTLTGDRLEMYFRSDRPGTSGSTDLWMTTRTTTSSPWAAPIQVAGLNTKSTELTPEISLDGLTIWFSTNLTGSQNVGSFDIWVSRRASRGTAWGTPSDERPVNSNVVDFAGTVFPDFLTMMLASQRAGGLGGDDIYLATRPNLASPWGTAVLVTELSTAVNDSGAYPVDANDIYLSSVRSGDQELYVSRRANTGLPFGTPVRIPELGSPQSDEAPWVSADERDIFFSSDRSGIYQIYEATR